MQYLVRYGALDQIAAFSAADKTRFFRGNAAICRTNRGLEVGEIITEADPVSEASDFAGVILRRMTPQDELIQTRLKKDRDRAIEDCQKLLDQFNSDAVILDVEQLFDGNSIFFYFLGDTTEIPAIVTDRLAEVYESRVKFKQFTEAAIAGCGPDCGTESASGCSSKSGCSTCAAAGACKK